MEAVQGLHQCVPASDENLAMAVQLMTMACTRCSWGTTCRARGSKMWAGEVGGSDRGGWELSVWKLESGKPFDMLKMFC